MRFALIPESGTAPTQPPLDADTFAALMQKFGDASRFALAVSGGPDSMALALCMKRWAADKAELIALIVDHALRPESAQEAEETRKRLKTIGMQAEILHWEHAPIVAKLHATARKARYRLLTEACHRHGIHNLLLAHQQEDQAETILMRLAKGSGVDGLAGISADTLLDGVRLLRPFLNIPKERLIATCREAKLDFIDDASNRSEKFARGRLRKVLPLLADEGLTIEHLTDLGARAADAKEALDHYTHAFLRNATKRDEAGAIRIGLESLRALPRAIAGRALALCLQDVHPEDYAPEHAALMSLVDALRGETEMPARTLHGCLVSQSATQALILREYGNIADAAELRPGGSVLWDGRWRVTLDKTADCVFTIRPLGSPPHEVLDGLAPDLRRRKVPQGRARSSLPALWRGEELVLIPSFADSGPARAQLVSAWPPR